jgi:CheY-like chemotaxis protein
LHTVLLLEPQPLQRRALRQALLGAGVARVLEADTAAEALRLMSAHLVALVLAPWQAPDMGGRPLLAALRNRGRNHDVPVVLLDRGLPRNQVVAAVKAGVAARLSLPADAAAVRALLEGLAADPPPAAAPPGADAPSLAEAPPAAAPRARHRRE